MIIVSTIVVIFPTFYAVPDPHWSEHPLDNVWAFIRVRNEGIIFKYMLASIDSVFTHGVIAISDSTDSTESLAINFTFFHPNFIIVKYPFSVLPPGDPNYETFPPPGRRLDFYYNYVLSFVPRNCWLVKLDGDVIYDTKSLQEIISGRGDHRRMICFARLHVWCISHQAFILKKNPIINPCDHFMIFNDELSFRLSRDPIHGFMEQLSFPWNTKFRWVRAVMLHFAAEKKWKRWRPPLEDVIAMNESLIKLSKKCTEVTCNAQQANRLCEIFGSDD
jgi:hypothetical protein